MGHIAKILVLVDFSKPSERAVRYGITVGRGMEARLYFLHMINRRMIDALHDMSGKGYKGEFLKALRKLMEDREKDLREVVPADLVEGMEVEFLIRKGEPADEVINVAKELSIDLIVVGSQGHTAGESETIGSVAQHVLQHAPCPVLLVRPLEHDFIA